MNTDTMRTRLRQNGFALSRTYGNSMRPLIWGGQHCVVVVPLVGQPSPGDLLMFRYKVGDTEKNIVHRLVEIRRAGEDTVYITRGDNCSGCEAVCPEDVIGRVAEVHRNGGYRPWYIIPSAKFSVTGRAYRFYSGLWSAIWPARCLYYRLRGRVGAAARRMLSRFKS